MREAPIVVGIDGSPTAGEAVAWASTWAANSGRSLRLLTAGDHLDPKQVTAMFVRETAAVLEKHPDLVVDCVHERSHASAALIEASRAAYGVVVGSRGAGGWDDLRVGSVARDVSAYAHCVVAVVPPALGPVTEGPVVVGVDGSPESEEAAEFAARQARVWHRDLMVVSAADAGAPQAGLMNGSARDPGQAYARAERVATDSLEGLRGLLRGFGGRVEAKAIFGRPAIALAHTARRASLLVVGARGAGGFAGKLIGSTSRALLEVSDGPVVIVRA